MKNKKSIPTFLSSVMYNINYAFNKNLMEEKDFSLIEKGICPKRVNGSFSVNKEKNKITQIDTSKKATNKSGKALVAAIKNYIKEYYE